MFFVATFVLLNLPVWSHAVNSCLDVKRRTYRATNLFLSIWGISNFVPLDISDGRKVSGSWIKWSLCHSHPKKFSHCEVGWVLSDARNHFHVKFWGVIIYWTKKLCWAIFTLWDVSEIYFVSFIRDTRDSYHIVLFLIFQHLVYSSANARNVVTLMLCIHQ